MTIVAGSSLWAAAALGFGRGVGFEPLVAPTTQAFIGGQWTYISCSVGAAGATALKLCNTATLGCVNNGAACGTATTSAAYEISSSITCGSETVTCVGTNCYNNAACE